MAKVGGAVSALVALVFVLPFGPPEASADDVPLASGESVAGAVDSVTTFPTELDPRIWTGLQMKPDVRDATLRIVDQIVSSTGIDGLAVDSVELFGSNVSYEYDDSSDFGVHAFVHSTAFPPEQLAPLLDLLNDDIERRQEGRILFYGVPLEVTFHAARTQNYQPQAGIGQYSISEGRWIEMPTQQPDNFDRSQMMSDAMVFVGKYNDLASSYATAKKGFACSRFGALDDEMAAYRDSGFSSGLGSRSTQNLTYRVLRRLNISIPDMVDTLEDDCTFVNESVG